VRLRSQHPSERRRDADLLPDVGLLPDGFVAGVIGHEFYLHIEPDDGGAKASKRRSVEASKRRSVEASKRRSVEASTVGRRASAENSAVYPLR